MMTCSGENSLVKVAPLPLVENNSLPKGEQARGEEKQGSVVSVRAGCSHCIPKVEFLQREHPKTQVWLLENIWVYVDPGRGL